MSNNVSDMARWLQAICTEATLSQSNAQHHILNHSQGCAAAAFSDQGRNVGCCRRPDELGGAAGRHLIPHD